jgi:uncharacterized integral membrane protein
MGVKWVMVRLEFWDVGLPFGFRLFMSWVLGLLLGRFIHSTLLGLDLLVSLMGYRVVGF